MQERPAADGGPYKSGRTQEPTSNIGTWATLRTLSGPREAGLGRASGR